MPPAATANTPRNRRKRGDQHLAHIGQEGRQTGLTVQEQDRDDAGFEPVDTFFSSASKAATTARTARTTRTSVSSSDESQSMDIALSSGPDVVTALSTRRQQRSSAGPPPQSRSPIKTNIGATPKRPRSAGGAAQSKHTPQSEGQPSSHGPVSRLLDFSTGDTRSSLRPRRQSGGSSPQRPAATTSGRPSTRNTYSISPSPESGRNSAHNYDEGTGHLTEIEQFKDAASASASASGPAENDSGLGMDDEPSLTQVDADQDDPILPQMEDDDEDEDDGGEPQVMLEEDDLDDAEPSATAATAGDDEEVPVDPDLLNPKAKRGRPRKADTANKKAKAANSAKPRRGRPPLAKKDPNRKLPDKGFKRPALPPRALQRARQETPYEEDGDSRVFTRSGRLSYKPLAEWKGEKALFTCVEDEHGIPLNTITNIVRMDDVTPQKRKFNYNHATGRPAQRKRRKQNAQQDDDGSQPEPEREPEVDPDQVEEPWELDEGVVTGLVKMYDPVRQTGIDERSSQEIAFAASRIEARDNGEGSFKFAKTLTMPFFGSGIVELPPRGFKRMKNSRKMQMMFFLHLGKVTVEVAGNRFVLSKGGVWQVPRGNFYSIENDTDRPAKIFFAQGCEVDED